LKSKYTIFILSSITLLNFFLSDQIILGNLFGLIQILIVIYLILIKKVKTAFIWHLIFFVSSLNFSIMSDSVLESTVTYNYSKLKFFGAFPIVYILNLIFFIIIRKNGSKNQIFNKFIKEFLFINVIATFTGIFGLLLYGYSLHYFIVYFYYCSTLYFILTVFARLFNFTYFILFRDTILLLLLISPICSLFLMLFNFNSFYGGVTTIPVNSLFLFVPFILFSKYKLNKPLYFLSLFSFSIVSLFSTGGKGVVFILLIILLIIFLKIKSLKRKFTFTFILIFSYLLIFNGPSLDKLYLPNNSGYLAVHKFNQFITIFDAESNLENVSTSPRVRIAETLNISYLYLNSPFKFLFGTGFGGYFEDYLGLFKLIDLSKGSFSNEQIISGKFYRPHDSLPVIFLLYGLPGLVFYFRWGYKIFTKSVYSRYFAGVIPWLILTYGFDLNIAITGVIFLYLACYEFKNFNNKISYPFNQKNENFKTN